MGNDGHAEAYPVNNTVSVRNNLCPYTFRGTAGVGAWTTVSFTDENSRQITASEVIIINPNQLIDLEVRFFADANTNYFTVINRDKQPINAQIQRIMVRSGGGTPAVYEIIALV